MGGIPTFLTPGLGNRFPDWLRVVGWRNYRVLPRYYHRVAIVGAINLLSSPFQAYESFSLRKKLARTEIHPAPVFIIGHWRSGTTLLHNLLSQDEQFGYVHTVQSLFPHSFMTNPLFPWLTKVLMPGTRPMDDMRLYLRSPQEEEMAMVNYGPWSYYHSWHFPGSIRDYYRQLVRMEGISDREKQSWEGAYLKLLRKTTLYAGGKRLVLKNPANTARIPTLLNLFPDARFIFLHRDPFVVYPSTQKLYGNVVPVFQLQHFDKQQVDRDIIWIYRDLLTSYLRDRGLVAENRLQEVMYPELAKGPMSVLERIYSKLELGGFAEAKPAMEAYLAQRAMQNYSPSRYELSESTRQTLRREWAFTWEAWPGV